MEVKTQLHTTFQAVQDCFLWERVTPFGVGKESIKSDFLFLLKYAHIFKCAADLIYLSKNRNLIRNLLAY